MKNHQDVSKFYCCFLKDPLTWPQTIIVIVFCLANIFQAITVGIQTTFYSYEAEKRGATASEYGMVFGVFELTVFVCSPICGKLLSKIEAKRMFNFGIMSTGSFSILFGLLGAIQNRTLFIVLSMVTRFGEAIGNAAFLTASFSIIAQEFPTQAATIFSYIEAFYGFGLIFGPTIGGLLYQWQGFFLPFGLNGLMLFGVAVITFFFLPDGFDEDVDNQISESSIWETLKIPQINLTILSILLASSSAFYLQTNLEPQLRHSKFNAIFVDVAFAINGGFYALSSPIFGLVCDKVVHPSIINHLGAVLIVIGFTLLGPAPFLSLEPSAGLTILSLVLHGIGVGAIFVSSFTLAYRYALANGFDDNIKTYGLISGLWASSFAFGGFVTPISAGFLVDSYGFEQALLSIVFFGIIFIFISILFNGYKSLKTIVASYKIRLISKHNQRQI